MDREPYRGPEWGPASTKGENSDGRGQASVIGVVLILGLVVGSMAVIAALGGAALLDTKDELSSARAQKVMTEFDSQSALVALGEARAQQMELPGGTNGDYTLDGNSGRIWVKINDTNTSSPETVVDTSLGALTYRTGEMRVAYQGGGVWKKSQGDAVMVSPPEFHYRERTLTLPIVNVVGDSHVSGQVKVQSSGADQKFPDRTKPDYVNPVPKGNEIVVTVKSDYYEGWGRYFELRTEGGVTYDHPNETVTVTLTVPIEESFDNAIAATGTGNSVTKKNNGKIAGTVEKGVTRPSASDRIDERIANCQAGNCTTLSDDPSSITAGQYYHDEDLEFGDNTTLDTTGGDIDIVVNGSVDFGGGGGPGVENHDIIGGGNVTLYVKGDVEVDGNSGVNTDGNASDLLTYVHSDAGEIVAASGTPQYTGLIYAPNSELEINGGGACGPGSGCTSNINGSVVVERAEVGNGIVRYAGDIQYTVDFDGEAAITYLHISENEVRVTGA